MPASGVPKRHEAAKFIGRAFARPLAVDIALYAFVAPLAWWLGRSARFESHRRWGSLTAWQFCAAAGALLIAWAISAGVRARRGDAGRPAPDGLRWAAVALLIVGTAVVPTLVNVVDRADGDPGTTQSEVLVVERSGDRLWRTGSPYPEPPTEVSAESDPLRYSPYQPLMAVFGLPRAWFGSSAWTDVRLWFGAVTAICGAATIRLSVRRDARLRMIQAMAIVPPAALTLATGGDDLPVAALSLLALALASRRRWLGAGITVGALLSLKLIAVPLAVALTVLAWAGAGTIPRDDDSRTRRRDRLRRFVPPAALIPLAACVPALVLTPEAFVENVVRYPLGLGRRSSTAASPLPGNLIAGWFPGGRWVALGLLALGAGGIVWWLMTRPPTTARQAAIVTAAGLSVAMLLAPSTRFGYAIYPVWLAAWALSSPGATRSAYDARPTRRATGRHDRRGADARADPDRRLPRARRPAAPAGP